MSPETFIAVEKIGGNWAIARSNPPVIEAGSHHPRLERLHGRTYVLVAKEPFPYKYIGDDCVIFTTLTTQYQLWAACGEGRQSTSWQSRIPVEFPATCFGTTFKRIPFESMVRNSPGVSLSSMPALDNRSTSRLPDRPGWTGKGRHLNISLWLTLRDRIRSLLRHCLGCPPIPV